jgi:MFS family permease
MADVLLLATVTMVAGALFFGWFTDRMRNHGIRPLTICGGGTLVFLIVQAMMIHGHLAPPWVITVGFSFFGVASAMNYAIVAQSMPAELTGRVSTSFNLLIFVVAFVMQWGMGAIIDTWPAVDGQYPEAAYQVALACCLGLQIPGFLIWLSFKPWQK